MLLRTFRSSRFRGQSSTDGSLSVPHTAIAPSTTSASGTKTPSSTAPAGRRRARNTWRFVASRNHVSPFGHYAPSPRPGVRPKDYRTSAHLAKRTLPSDSDSRASTADTTPAKARRWTAPNCPPPEPQPAAPLSLFHLIVSLGPLITLLSPISYLPLSPPFFAPSAFLLSQRGFPRGSRTQTGSRQDVKTSQPTPVHSFHRDFVS